MKEKLYLTLRTVFNTVFYTTGKSIKIAMCKIMCVQGGSEKKIYY